MAAIETFSVDTNGAAGRPGGGRSSAFGYDGTVDKKHRRRIDTTTRSEDDVATPSERRKLKAIAEDVRRNFEVPAWGLRSHLDWVSCFTFRAASGNDDWDNELERFVANWSQPLNCDASGRHSLDSLGRLAEAHRTVDGDVGVYKLRDGRIQLSESDRIKDPPQVKAAERWIHGVKVNPQGAALAYSLYRRRSSAFEFDRTVPASWLYLHAYRDRYDQVRGISPLAAALNRFRDVYEGFDLAHAKLKVAQLFGLAIYGQVQDDEPDPNAPEEEKERRAQVFKLDPNKGPYTLNLREKARTEVLESKNPSSEFQNYSSMMLRVALLSIDLPYAFLDPREMNYSTMKTALAFYIKRCGDKRRANRDLRDHLIRWRIGLAIATGELEPQRFGIKSFDEIRWLWIPHGTPWLDKSKDVPADSAAVVAGFQTWGDVTEERLGVPFIEVLKRRAREETQARELGIWLPGMKAAEPAAAAPAAGDAEPDDEEPADGPDAEKAKAVFDAYGAAVRAGAITPQRDDEQHFRSMLGLPSLTPPVEQTWQQEPTRRPVTLTPPPSDEKPPAPAPAAGEEGGQTDEEPDAET